MKYFPNTINGVDQLKVIYKNLCKEHHPDKGGDSMKFIEMKVEYDSLLKKFESGIGLIDNEALIDDLNRHRVDNDYKAGWVYYKFVELAEQPSHNDFIYLANVLGYQRGWAYYKWKEYEDDLSRKR